MQPILQARCACCHHVPGAPSVYGGGGVWPAFEADGAKSYATLLSGGFCTSGVRLVAPGDPAHSALLWKLGAPLPADAPPGLNACFIQDKMPAGTAGLKTIAPDEFAAIERWIDEGAPAN